MALSNEQWNAPSGGADFYDHQIANSVRTHFGDDNSTIKRTPSTDGNRATWSISIWMKRAHLGANQFIFESGASGNFDTRLFYLFTPTGGIEMSSGEVNYGTTTELFRDVGAWYHIFIKNVSNSNTLYVNGTLIKTTTLSGNTAINKASEVHGIGTRAGSGNNERFGGYIAEFLLFDGTAYAPTDVAENKNGVWIPKDPSGLTLNGENTTWLKFANSGALGTDSSGEGNTWTIGSAITAKDQMLDTPTFGSDNGGNFATLNPLAGSAENILTEGNLKATKETGSYNECTPATMNLRGKYYLECCAKELLAQNLAAIGLVNVSEDLTNGGRDSRMDLTGVSYSESGELQTAGNRASFGDAWEAGDIIQMAVDMTNINSVKVWFGNNNVWQNSGDPAAGSGEAATITNGEQIMAMSAGYSGTGELVFNFGQEGTFAGEKTAGGNADANGYGNFIYAPPTNFLALCSGNLPTADAVDPAQTSSNFPQKLFNTKLYTGTGASLALTGVGFQPDWTWVKERGGTNDYKLTDSTRGVTKSIESNTDVAEATDSNGLTAFGADGFTVGSDVVYNNNTDTYLGWNWRANGGTTSTNSTGSLSVTQQVDPSGSFSISTYSGDGGTDTIGHGLSSAPTMVIIKQVNGANNWAVYAKGAGATKYAYLDSGAAFGDAAMWQNTAPSSSLVYLGDNNEVNAGSRTYVAYCFADTEGYCKSGVYEGNANADGTFVYTGFSPAWLMIKRADGIESWFAMDDKRDPYNVVEGVMQLNGSNGESTTDYDALDFLSNGFKLRLSDVGFNGAESYIYLAMSSNPFQYATAK